MKDKKFSRQNLLLFTAKESIYVANREYNEFLYYTRLSYDVTFKNVNETYLTVKNIPFGKPLADFTAQTVNGTAVPMRDVVPTYPKDWEQGVYEFDGWYTTANCFAGTEYWFDEDDTMPSGGLELFAKWVPVTRTVTFHETYEDMVAREMLLMYWPLTAAGLALTIASTSAL